MNNMRSVYRKAGIFALVLFVCGIFLSAFLMYKLPDELLKNSVAIGETEIVQIKPVLYNINIIVSITLLSGLLSTIFLLLFKGDNSHGQITYIETSDKTKKTDANPLKKNEECINYNNGELENMNSIIENSASVEEAGTKILSTLSKRFEASQAALYKSITTENKRYLRLFASYAFIIPESETLCFEYGEGLVGQAAKEGRSINIRSVPEGYIRVFSGLGNSTPNNLLLVPLKYNDTVLGVGEIASFKGFAEKDKKLVEDIFATLAGMLAAEGVAAEYTEGQ